MDVQQTKPFNLRRYYSYVSFAFILVIAVALGVLTRHYAVTELIAIAEDGNVALTTTFKNSLWPKFGALVQESYARSPAELKASAEIPALRRSVVSLMDRTDVVKVKIYNLNGITVFSTDSRQIGDDKKGNAGFQAALRGQVASELTHRDTFDAFEGAIEDRDLLSSYLPIRSGDNKVEAVFELYNDVTPFVGQLERTQIIIVASVVGLLGLLYAALFVVVARAHEIIGIQRQSLEKANEQLDARVRERTTELLQANERLRLTAAVFENTQEGVVITRPDTHIVAVNRAFTEITGYSTEEAMGATPKLLLQSGRQEPAFYERMWADLEATGQWRGEVWNRRKNGDLYPEWLSISAVRDDQGELSHYVGVFSDITEVKKAQEKLNFLAYHDPLTQLPNRLLFNDRLSQTIQRANREHKQFAIFFIDLDHFKNVNDSLGHHVGDRLLRVVSAGMLAQLRSCDTLARLGGDEFILLIEDIHGPESAAAVAEKVLSLFASPLRVDHHELYITASIGICVYPADGDDINTLIKNADAAMYQAKAHGRNKFHFYAQEMTAYAMERLELESALRKAVHNKELVLCYQPQIDLATRRIVGAEALVRWHHPTFGLIQPIKFIPLAEDTGLINQIGEWVLRTACQQMKRWEAAGFRLPKVAVNISVKQLERNTFAALVGRILQETQLDPASLELELTESVLMQTEEAFEVIEELEKLGVYLSVDDFGTGYSSLSYLKRLPVHKLKIDRSFITDVTERGSNKAIVRAVIAMAKTLGLSAVAEGVESIEQAAFLQREGCDQAQGFLYGKPVLPEDFVDAWKGLSAPVDQQA